MLSIRPCQATCNVHFYKNILQYQQNGHENSGLFICVLQNEQKETVWHEIAKSIQWYFKRASLSSRSCSFRKYVASWKSTWLMSIFLPSRLPFNNVRFVLIRTPKSCIFLRGNRVKIFVIYFLIKISKPLLSWKTGNVRFFDYIISRIKFKLINDIIIIIRW